MVIRSLQRKGFIRTLEAIIAIVIILIVSFTVVTHAPEEVSDVPSVVKASQKVIIQNLNLNETMRSCVLDNLCDTETSLISDLIEANQPPGYEYAFRICSTPNCICNDEGDDPPCQVFGCFVEDGNRTCEVSPEGYPKFGEVYMADTFIAAKTASQKHHIVRFWMWRVDE